MVNYSNEIAIPNDHRHSRPFLTDFLSPIIPCGVGENSQMQFKEIDIFAKCGMPWCFYLLIDLFIYLRFFFCS